MKKLFTSIGCVIAATILATGCSLSTIGNTYNENPDLSRKVVGSKSAFALSEMEPIKTIDDLVDDPEIEIVVGEVISDGEKQQFNMYGDEEAAQQELEMGRNPYMPCTITKVRVEESIYGDFSENSEFELFQLGVPDDDGGQTKVKNGERLVMLLRPSGIEGRYYSCNVEHTMFYLDENDMITSMSDELICARYDGTSKNFLVKDLLDALDNKAKEDK